MAAEDDDLGNLWFRLGVEPDDESARRAFAEMGRQINDYFKRIQDQFDAAAKEQAKSQRAASSATAKEQKKGFDAQEALLRAFIAQFQRLQKAHVDKMLADNAASNARRLEGQQSLNKALLQEQKRRDREALQEQEHVNKEIRNQSRLSHEQILDDYKQLNREIIQDQILANRKILESDAQANRHRMENHKQRNRESLQQQKAGDALYLEEQKKANRESLQNQRIAASQSLAEQKREHDKRLEEIRQANRKEMEDHRQANRETLATLNEGIKSRLMAQRSGEKIAEQAAAAAEKRKTLELEYAEKRRLSVQDAAQQKSINAHKSMWAIIRTITETGGRFLSSITQSALKSMGNAVGYGMRGVLSRFRRSTDQQEDVLRGSYKQQEAITRGGLARQEGAIAAFQTRANRGLIGTLFNLRNVLAGAGVYLGARAIFGPVMEYEQTQVAFENLLGSADKAASLLADLREFNVATPFELPQIQNAAKQLLAMGETMQEVVPDLTAIGDVGAKFSASSEDVNGVIRALGQMSQSAKVSAQDINQIQQRFVGFNARAAIARGLGISVAEAMEKIADGSISGNEGMNAMIEGMKSEANAAGAMEEQMKTLTGRLSNFKDLLNRILLDVMVPLLPVMQRIVEWFTSFIDSLVYGNGIFAVARSVLLGVGIALGLIVAQEAAATVLDAVGQSLKLIAANPLTALTAAVVILGTTLYRHNDDFRDFVDGFLDPIQDFVARWKQPVIDALTGIAHSIGEVVAAVSNGDFSGALDLLKEAAAGLAEDLKPAATFLVDFGQEAWQKWQDWLDGGGLGDLGETIKLRILDALVKVQEGVEAIDWEKLLRPAMALAGVAIAGLILGWPGIIGGALVAGILLLSPRVREGVTGLFDKAKDWITELWSGIDWGAIAMTVLNGIREIGEFTGGPVMQAIFSDTGLKIMGGIALGLVAAAGALALGLAQGLKESLPIVWDNLGDIVKGGMHTLSDKVKRTPLGPIISAFTETFSRAFDAVGKELDFLSAIIDAMTGKGDWGDAVDKGVDAFLGWWRIVLSAPQLVRGISESMNMLLTEALSGASTAVTEWARGLEGRFGDFVQIATAPWAFIVGIISDILDRVRDFVRGWIDVIAGIFSGDFGRIFEGVRGIWGSLFGFIRDVIGRFQTFMWSVLSGLGSLIWQNVTGGLSWVKTKFFEWGLGILGWFESLPGKIARAFGDIGTKILNKIKDGIGGASGFAGDIVDAIKGFINTEIIDRLNGLLEFEFDTHIPGVGVVHLDAPDIHPLAKGGIVTRPTLALIGEAGPEAVVPLSGTQGQIPLNIMFDVSAVAGQMAAIVALLAPLGQMILEATAPGMRAWEAGFVATLASITRSLTQWGTATTSLAAAIAAGIVAGITTGLRTGKAEVTAIVRGYGRSLVGALNPLLTGIGEPAVTLAYAKGGIAEAHAGPQVHVFNEGKRGRGSSHGEAYIPFDPSNRPRSRSLATETVRRLGGDVQWFANGGITASQVQPGTSLPGVSGDVVGLITEFARRLSTWSLANGGGYHVGSGYRSIARQAELYRDYLAGVPGQAPAAPPGSSLHNFGLASDGNHWRDRNPAAFGLTFPMSYEPWHVQPVEGKGLLNGDSAFPMFEPLPQPPSAGRRGVLSTVAAAWMRYVYDKTLAKAGSFTAPMDSMPTLGSAGASPEIMAAIRRAMQIVGVPASWLGPLLTLISRESGFNPRAYNGVLGASGLMQTIPATFASNALPGYGGIFDPLANVIAGLRYILGRYGSIFNVGQAVAAHPTKGYSYGGVVERDGMYRLSEGNRREVVLPLENRGRLLELLRRTGLDKTIAMASGVHPDNGLLPVGSATSRTSPSLGPVVGEMNVYSNATDPEAVGTIAANKVDRQVRSVLTGVGSL